MNGTNYITIGYNFLQLAINSIEEMSLQGNKTTISMKGGLSDVDAWKKYEERTKWNDHNIAVPVLFNFFHGSELILKGLILHCGGELKRKSHKLTSLLDQLKRCPNPPSEGVIKHMNKIVTANGFEDYFKENNTTVDSFYEIFKYPELKDGIEIQYWELRGKEKSGLERFLRVQTLAKLIKEEIVKWKNTEQ